MSEYRLNYTAQEIDEKLGKIDGLAERSEIPEAVNDALAQAKASGEFDGADGKSAYEYAKDGGYTGTEAEFAEEMAGRSAMNDFIKNTDIDYAFDESTGAYYTVVRIYKHKLDGTYQYPFVYAPNGYNAGNKSTYDMVMTDGYLFAINAGVFDSRLKPDGMLIQNGVVIQNTPTTAEHSMNKPLTIDSNGDLYYAEFDANAHELVSSGVISAVCGFIPIIINYSEVPASEWNNVSHYSTNAQRQIIGQWGNGDYAILTCEGRAYHNSDGWTLAEAQAICKKHGLKFAYNLDGGGSTETMLGKKHINTMYDGATGRRVPTFIVFNGRTTPPSTTSAECPRYNVTNNLTNVSTSNPATVVLQNARYRVNLSVTDDDYTLDGALVKITMGGADITSNSYTNGVINISSVTGDIVITASAKFRPSQEDITYILPEETVFDGTSTYIDTGINLAKEDVDFTIAFHATPASNNTDPAVIFHCIYEASPYPGYMFARNGNSTDYFLTSYSANYNKTGISKSSTTPFKVVITHEAGSGLVTMKAMTNGNVTSGSKNATSYTWSQANTAVIIGAYQSTSGVKGRYWAGTMHDFKIINRVWTNDEVSSYLQ